MLDYLIRRLAGTIPVLLAVSVFVFLFVHLLPGDPARLVVGPDASAQDIAAVGVTVKVESLEAGVLTAKMFNVQKPEDASIVALYTAWSSSTGDADWGTRPMLYTKSFPPVLANLAWYSNPVTDAAIEEGLSTVDPTKRAAAYAKAQAQAWQDTPWIYLGVEHNLAAYSKKLHGAFIRPDQQFHLTEDAALD